MRKLTLVTALVCSVFSVNSYALYSRVFVFGDSLSDNGNAFIGSGGETETTPYTDLIPDRPYSSGTLSNGPVWTNLLGPSVAAIAPPPSFSLFPTMNLDAGANFSVGGARSGPLTDVAPDGIPTLLDQAGTLLSIQPNLDSDALYVVWAGGNDVRAALLAPASAGAIMQDALGNMSDIMGLLGSAGARNILLMNMPDVSHAPAIAAFGEITQAFTRDLIQTYNDNLALLVAAFEANSGIDVMTIDMFALLTDVLENPGNFGFSDATNPCHFENGGMGCSDPDQHFFWDGLHPTTAGHRLIASAVTATVVPVPAALPLLMSGLAVIGATRLRRRAA